MEGEAIMISVGEECDTVHKLVSELELQSIDATLESCRASDVVLVVFVVSSPASNILTRRTLCCAHVRSERRAIPSSQENRAGRHGQSCGRAR